MCHSTWNRLFTFCQQKQSTGKRKGITNGQCHHSVCNTGLVHRLVSSLNQYIFKSPHLYSMVNHMISPPRITAVDAASEIAGADHVALAKSLMILCTANVRIVQIFSYYIPSQPREIEWVLRSVDKVQFPQLWASRKWYKYFGCIPQSHLCKRIRYCIF